MSTRCPRPTTPLPTLESDDVVDWAAPILRIYASGGPYPSTWSSFRYFGPVSSMRFDHQPRPARDHPTRGVTYTAGRWDTRTGTTDPLEVAVLERFQRDGILDRYSNNPRYVLWTPQRPLRLLQLSDSDWLARAGGNAALMSGARGIARDWSRAIYRTYEDIDGMTWSCGLFPTGRSMVLNERAEDAVPAAPSSDRALSEAFLQPALGRIASRYGLTLV